MNKPRFWVRGPVEVAEGDKYWILDRRRRNSVIRTAPTQEEADRLQKRLETHHNV